MTWTSYVLGITASVVVLAVAFEQLRRRRLRERHAVWWLGAGTLALLASIFPRTLDWLADLAGVELPVNLVFFASIAVLFLVSLQHSAELTALESRTRLLAEHIVLLELKLAERDKTQESEGP